MIHERTWQVKTPDRAKVLALKEALGNTREQLCSLFVSRGLDTFDKAKTFFNPCLSHLHDPWLLKDMDKATRRIDEAAKKGEKILLFGDYDVDGTTAVAMMLRFLQHRIPAEQVHYYIPDRYKEGYGLSEQGISFALAKGITLIITLDCGITAAELMNNVIGHGLDFIICDHHLPGSKLPPAVAILNPHQRDCSYPFKDLCGSGVALKLIMALCDRWDLPPASWRCYLDMVALATGADVVPIRGENRTLVHFGLAKLNDDPCAGIRALKQVSGVAGTFSLTRVIFNLAPRINAAGRMDHGRYAVKLLTTDDPDSATHLANMLHNHNEQRRAQDELVTREAMGILQEQGASRASVVFREGWHQGVLGIVASRLIEKYYRPTIVLTAGEKHVSGSARSIHGFNIYEAIYECREHLIRFGGHVAAAGVSLLPENITAFSKKFESVVSERITDEIAIPKIRIDLEITLADIDWPFYNTLSRMEPFGHENETPIFLTRNVRIHPESRIVGSDHVRFVLPWVKDQWISGIAFNQKIRFESLDRNTPIDFVYSIDENEWNNRKSLQLKIIDFKPSC